MLEPHAEVLEDVAGFKMVFLIHIVLCILQSSYIFSVSSEPLDGVEVTSIPMPFCDGEARSSAPFVPIVMLVLCSPNTPPSSQHKSPQNPVVQPLGSI